MYYSGKGFLENRHKLHGLLSNELEANSSPFFILILNYFAR